MKAFVIILYQKKYSMSFSLLILFTLCQVYDDESYPINCFPQFNITMHRTHHIDIKYKDEHTLIYEFIVNQENLIFRAVITGFTSCTI